MVIGFLRGRYKFDLRNFAPPVKFSLKMACHRLMIIILSIVNRFKKFFTGRFLGKFAVK